jgi:hypothetical protein
MRIQDEQGNVGKVDDDRVAERRQEYQKPDVVVTVGFDVLALACSVMPGECGVVSPES